MAQKTKYVSISPPEAAQEGCSATCISYVEDKTREVSMSGGDKAYRTFTNYVLEAFPATLWKFKNFVYTVFYTDTDGVSHSYDITRTPANSGTVYPSTLHTEYETEPTDYTSIEPEGKHIDARPTESFSNVRAVFEFNGYRITTSVSPSGGGTATGGGPVAKNSSVTLRATPSTGYSFDGWYENGSLVYSNATYSFTATKDRTLVAQFSMTNPVTVTLVAHNGWGQVRFQGETPTTGTVSKTVPAGTSVTIEATATGNRRFGYWNAAGINHYTNPLTFTADNDATYTAMFCYFCTARVAALADPDKTVSVGEVQIRDGIDGTESGWRTDVGMPLYNDAGGVYVEQRSLGGGWTFVKWRLFSNASGVWWEDTSEYIYISMSNIGTLVAIALFQRSPTNLLVNSSTYGTPVRLVYDDRSGGTGLLVADC